jgi:hypothetical protein
LLPTWFVAAGQFDLAPRAPKFCVSTYQKRKKVMNEIAPIKVIRTTKRSAPCGKTSASTRSSTVEVRQLQAELAHVRNELQTLRYATQQFVRQML